MEILVCQDDKEISFYRNFFSFLNNNEKLLKINTKDIERVSNDLCYNKKSKLSVYDINKKTNKIIVMYYKTIIEGWDCRKIVDYEKQQAILSLKEIQENEANNCNS